MLQFVPDVEAADRDHEGRRGGRQGADDHAADQHGPQRENQHTSCSSGGIPVDNTIDRAHVFPNFREHLEANEQKAGRKPKSPPATRLQ